MPRHDIFQRYGFEGDIGEACIMSPEATKKQVASHGYLNVEATMKIEYSGQEPMFAVRLARISESPVATVDVTWELQRVYQRLTFVDTLLKEDNACLEMELSTPAEG